MATQWLRVWLDGVGVHGLQPAPGEPLVRWLLVLHERAAIEEQIATDGLEAHHAAAIDQLRDEIIATQRDTLPAEAQDAVGPPEGADAHGELGTAGVGVDPADSAAVRAGFAR